MELSLLILVCILKSYIVYFEISVVPIGHGFSFFSRGKVMANQCWKRGGTLVERNVVVVVFAVVIVIHLLFLCDVVFLLCLSVL